MTAPKIPPEFDELSTSEKILLLQDLWDRIAENPEDVDVTDAQREELDCRLADHRDAPGDTRSWSEVKDRIQGDS